MDNAVPGCETRPPLAEHIAVSDENPFPGQRENFVIGSVQYHPALGLQVVERPEVVVTGKKWTATLGRSVPTVFPAAA